MPFIATATSLSPEMHSRCHPPPPMSSHYRYYHHVALLETDKFKFTFEGMTEEMKATVGGAYTSDPFWFSILIHFYQISVPSFL